MELEAIDSLSQEEEGGGRDDDGGCTEEEVDVDLHDDGEEVAVPTEDCGC